MVWVYCPEAPPNRNNKLYHKWRGPFRISNVIGSKYELDVQDSHFPLPNRMIPYIHHDRLKTCILPFDRPSEDRIGPIQDLFHSKFLPDESLGEELEDDEYEVEKILGHRVKDNLPFKGDGTDILEFCIKWVGYDNTYNTWEISSNLSCPERLQEYWGSLMAQRCADALRSQVDTSIHQQGRL